MGSDKKMLLNTDRDIGEKCLFSVRHILLSDTEFKGEVPAPFQLKYANANAAFLIVLAGGIGIFIHLSVYLVSVA